MLAPAQRLDGIQEYYFAGKLREIAQLRAQGRPIINLGIGSPDLPPHPTVIAALQTASADPQAHGYQSYTGIPALRQAWSDWYARYYGVALDPTGEVLPLLGSKEGIVHLAMTFLEAGTTALVPNPGYPTYRAATRLAGAVVREYALDAANGWRPDLPALAETDLSAVRIMWVNYPHMPTGAAADPAFFQQLVDFGRAHNILIVNDNPYSFILNDHPVSILAAEGADGAALELNSLSKAHNLAGWRVGALLGNADYLRAVVRFKSNLDSGQFLPIQLAAVEALGLPASWYRELNAIYRQRQTRAFALLRALGCACDEAQQGLFVWARIPAHYPDSYAFSDQLLAAADLFITPGAIFGQAGERYARVSLCQPVEVFEESIARCRTRQKDLHHPAFHLAAL